MSMTIEVLNTLSAMPAAPDPGGGSGDGLLSWLDGFFSDLKSTLRNGATAVIFIGILVAMAMVKGTANKLTSIAVGALMIWGVQNVDKPSVNEKIDNEVSQGTSQSQYPGDA